MSNISKRKKDGSRTKIKSMGDHKDFLKRITRTLYYGTLPSLPCLSLPVTEISCEVWSAVQRGRSVRRLHCDAAAAVARQACVSPAALVLALLYMERLRTHRPDYLTHTPPADLFLVTLMVGNKFLQDDGEDEEVFCSEWAESGGMELSQLKKLELEFLSAIDWNVYVSEKSFESGLQWLERRVALKQALLRGFFTYSDLTAGGDGGGLAAAALALATAGAAAAIAYAATLLALAAAALTLSHVCLSSQTPSTPTEAPATVSVVLPGDVLSHTLLPPLTMTQYVPNSTLDPPLECCSSWLRHRDTVDRKIWSDGVIIPDLRSFEPWWSRTSVLNWLYQSSLIGPLQRWLDKMDEYAAFAKDLGLSNELMGRCDENKFVESRGPQRCDHSVRPWLQLNKLGMVSMSDR